MAITDDSDGVTELRDLGLIGVPLDAATANRIKAKILIISGRYAQGVYAGDDSWYRHMFDVYHAIAEEIVGASTMDAILTDVIPSVVIAVHHKYGWLPHAHRDTHKLYLAGPIQEWKGKRLLMAVAPVAVPVPQFTSIKGDEQPKPRGRPPIPAERKVAAIRVKDAGGSNREAAVKLYNTKYPTSQQIKNVSTILRHFRKMKKSKSKPKTQAKPQ